MNGTKTFTHAASSQISILLICGIIIGYLEAGTAILNSLDAFIDFKMLYGFLLMIPVSLLTVLTHAAKHELHNDLSENVTYTSKHRRYDLTITFALLSVTSLLYGIVVSSYFGQTEKPIEQLNGFYLGHYYTPKQIDVTRVTVHQGGPDDHFAFYTLDNKTPNLKTYVFQSEERGVYKVVMAFENIKHTDKWDLKADLQEKMLTKYGGRPSITDSYLHHNNRFIDVLTLKNGVSITIREDESADSTGLQAKREHLSVLLRLMDSM